MLTALKQKGNEITKLQANISNIKQHASELQTFVALKQIEKDIAVEEQFIQTIIKTDTMNQVDISFQISKSLQQITASVVQFGDINVSCDPCNLSIQKRKNRQAQIMVALPTRNIDNLSLTLQKSINTDLSNVRGCSMLPDGKMVFSCYDQYKIRVTKADGSKDFEIRKIGPTFDVVFIGDDFIAVSSGHSDTINIIDLQKRKLKKSIKVNSNINGVVYKDGNLIGCAMEKGFKMTSLSDESTTTINSNKLSALSYVTTFRDKLFYTYYENHSVTCCDYHGNKLWTFINKSALKGPLGISVDNDGNVFVVGCDSDNLVVISPDGQRFRQLLSSEFGLKYPTAVHYDKSKDKLLVASMQGKACLFDVK